MLRLHVLWLRHRQRREVSRFAAVQFNDVHGAHRQTCAVNHTTDVTVQRNVVQFPLCSLCFTWIFLRLVAHFAQIRLAEQCVAISTQFTIEADQIALFGNNQRVNFDKSKVALKENGRQTHENFGELLNQFTFQPSLNASSRP